MQIRQLILGLLLIQLGIAATVNAAMETWKSSYPEILDLDYYITKAFAEKFNATLIASPMPFARRLYELENGDIDILCGLLKKPDREQYAHFLSTPYKRKSNKYFFMRKGEGERLKRYEDLYNLKVGVHIGSKYFSRFDNDQQISKVENPYSKCQFHMLLRHRIDTIILTDIYGLYLIRKMNLQEKIEVAPYRYSEDNPVYMAISRSSKLIERKQELEDVFRQMVESKEIDRIISSFFEK